MIENKKNKGKTSLKSRSKSPQQSQGQCKSSSGFCGVTNSRKVIHIKSYKLHEVIRILKLYLIHFLSKLFKHSVR